MCTVSPMCQHGRRCSVLSTFQTFFHRHCHPVLIFPWWQVSSRVPAAWFLILMYSYQVILRRFTEQIRIRTNRTQVNGTQSWLAFSSTLLESYLLLWLRLTKFSISTAPITIHIQAKNIVNYLRIIHRILAPGGVWINLGKFICSSLKQVREIWSSADVTGPLLWHFENNNTNDPSVELDLDEVKALARTMGFELSVSLFTQFL